MTIVIARIKQGGKWLLAVALLVGAAALAFFRFRKAVVHPADPIDLALQRYERQTATATARAAVEIAVARTKSKAEQDRLMDILKDTDEERQIDRLIAEAARLKGE